MTTTDLRAACIHGRYEMHGTESTRTPLPDGRVEVSNLCNGGRDITIDRQAAIVAVAEGISDHISAADDWTEWETEATALVTLAFAAAIGVTNAKEYLT